MVIGADPSGYVAAICLTAPGSQETLLPPSPLRTGRESFDLIRLKPLLRPFQDAVSQRLIFGCEPGSDSLGVAIPG